MSTLKEAWINILKLDQYYIKTISSRIVNTKRYFQTQYVIKVFLCPIIRMKKYFEYVQAHRVLD